MLSVSRVRQSGAAMGPSLILFLFFCSSTLGQSTGNAIFVANNGNLEGSVSAFRVNADGTLVFANKVVTGERDSTADPCAGCNAYDISITPDGRHLATCHPAGVLDGVTILRVNSDATIEQTVQVPLPSGVGAPLDLVWLDNEYLAVDRQDTNPDQIVIYRYDPDSGGGGGPSLNFINAVPTGTNSMSYFARHPDPRVPVMYANDSAQKVVRAFSFTPPGSLTLIDTESSGAPFPLELTINRAGTHMYAAGGISNGGNSVVGFDIAGDGTLTLMANSPFTSPGESPSNVYCDDDDTYLIVGHGTDATCRTMAIVPGTGALTPTDFTFDVGLQGTLGDVHSRGGFVFVTDNSTATDGITGIYSFTLGPTGTLTMNGGGIYSTQGIAPRSVASWFPAQPCPADVTGDGTVNIGDLLAAIAAWGPCPGCPEDVNDSGAVDIADLLAVIAAWGTCS